MAKKIAILFVLFSFCIVAYSQETTENSTQDKYTVNNYMISRIFQCPEGLIVNYIDNKKEKILYIPNRFFREKKAFRFPENDAKVSPQMNVVLKNKKPEKVKLYLSNQEISSTYRYIDVISKEMYEKFQSDEIEIDL